MDDNIVMDIQSALTIEELSIERDSLKCKIVEIEAYVRDMEEKYLRRVEDGMKEKESLLKEVKTFKARNEILEDNLTLGFGYLKSIKESLMFINEGVDQDHVCGETSIDESRFGCERMREFLMELDIVARMAKRVEKKFGDESHETLLKGLVALETINVSLMRIFDVLNEEVLNVEEKCQGSNEAKEVFGSKLEFVVKMVKRVEERLSCYHEKVVKEKRELENSVVSLTEENRDVSTLLRIALVEKEAAEKKLKGSNTEQKSYALLHLFGFMMGSGGGNPNEQSEFQKKDSERISDNISSDTSTVSDITSQREDEVVSLVSTVEKMMKSLRLEISQLRRSLEESRSDAAQLQSFVKKKTQQIREQKTYIKVLEDEGRIVSEKVEQLLIEIKATEEDAERWREACELEVDAGKRVVEERDKVIEILKQEVERTRASLKASNRKLKSKEEVAVAAMAAQSAAEKSVKLADIRSAGLERRIEELTKRLEEAEKSDKKHRLKTRRRCCPWLFDIPANNVTTTGARNLDVRRVLPEMEAFLNHDVLL